MYVCEAWFLIHWRTHFNYFRLSKFAKCFHPLLFLQHIPCPTHPPHPPAGHIGDRSVKDREPGYVKHSVIHTWERAVKMPFACLREDITLQGTMYPGYSIRCEEFCCSCVGEARICLTLHQFYYLKIVRNLKCVCWILSDFLLISILAACTRSEAEIRLCYSKKRNLHYVQSVPCWVTAIRYMSSFDVAHMLTGTNRSFKCGHKRGVNCPSLAPCCEK